MKTLFLKLIPGTLATLAALALGSLIVSRAQSSNDAPAAPAQRVAPGSSDAPVVTPAPAAAPAPRAPARVVYVVIDPRDSIRLAPAYYGPGHVDRSSRFSDPFSEIRVNPIPYPPEYCAPRFATLYFPAYREHRHGRRD